jgi:hypothetical protein
LVHDARRLHKQVQLIINRLGWWQRAALVLLLLAVAVSGLLFLIFNERIFAWLEPFADKWRNLRAGWLIVWLITFVSAFPPVVGYSTCLTIAGFLYGMPYGWVNTSCSLQYSPDIQEEFDSRLLRAVLMGFFADGSLALLPLSLAHSAPSSFAGVSWRDTLGVWRKRIDASLRLR